MRKPLLVGVLAGAALAALGHGGFELAGAFRQVVAIGRTKLPVRDVPRVEAAQSVARLEPAHAAVDVTGRAGSARVVPASRPPEPVAPAAEPVADWIDELPRPGLDPEAALHAAADADPNVSQLLDDADPAVGAAVRDFMYTLSAPGASTRVR